MKRAIHKYLDERITPYYAMKYRRQLADAIRISRYAGTDPIHSYILSSYKSVKGNTPEKLEAVYACYPEFAARREFIEMLEFDTSAAACILKVNKLDVESLSAFYNKFDCDVWEAAAELTPVMRFLKYLSKYESECVDVLEIAKTKLSVKNLKAAKVFPFRLYTAHQAVTDYRIAEYLQDLLDEYTLAYDWSSFNRYSWVIAPDMSGSMYSFIGKSNSLTYADVAAMFTGFFTRGLERVTVLPWNTEVLPYDMGRDVPVMEQIKYLKNQVSGGTFMECGVDYMLKNRIKADFSVFITDSEEYGRGWLEAWKRYKAFYPQAQAFLLRIDSYRSRPMSEADARKYGIRQVFGWNDAVVDYIKFIVENRRD